MEWNGLKIRQLRKRLDIEPAQFARILGATAQDIQIMEKPRYKPTRKIAETLDRLHERALRLER